MADFKGTFSVPALRGRMGSRDYYVLLLPLSVIPKLLPAPEAASLPVEARAQRKLNAKRVPEISRYILDNEDDWLFSSITASYPEDTEPEFISSPGDPDVGTLILPMDAELLVNDGQHRRAAIAEALKVDPTLRDQRISIVLFPGESLERNQQMFSDLNRTVQKTPRSLDIVYDHRDPLNRLTLSVAERVPLLRGRVDKEAISIGMRSAKLITVSALYDNLQQLLGPIPHDISDPDLDRLEERAVAFWVKATDAIPQWFEISINELRPAEARAEYISVHGVFFYALGTVGKEIMSHYDLDRLSRLSSVDYRRVNTEWQGICMLGRDIITRRQTRYALAQMLLYKAGVIKHEPARIFS